MKDKAVRNSIAILVIIVAVSGLLLSFILPALSKQGTSSSSSSASSSSSVTNSGCLTPAQSWDHIGERACVVFYPAKLARSGDYFFIDEKEDYKKGFVVFFARKNLLSWNELNSRYNGKILKVSGKIELYEGHPEIKVYGLDQISVMK